MAICVVNTNAQTYTCSNDVCDCTVNTTYLGSSQPCGDAECDDCMAANGEIHSECCDPSTDDIDFDDDSDDQFWLWIISAIPAVTVTLTGFCAFFCGDTITFNEGDRFNCCNLP